MVASVLSPLARLVAVPLVLIFLADVRLTPAQDAPTSGDIAARLPLASPLPAGAPRADGPLPVVATTGILADLVSQIGGPRVAAVSLLPANVDPHDFEPKPADLVAIDAAALIVTHGLGLDEWATALIGNAGSDAPVVVATSGITTLASDEAGFAAGDPHVWFDPTRTATMVDNITAALSAADPDGAATYQARATVYQTDLLALDAAIAAAVATIPPERREIVTNHDALAYYADRYGLTIVGTVIPGLETTAEPSAREITELLALIEQEGVPAIFAENTTSPTLAEELAAEAGIAVIADLYTDSLGEPGSGADTYFGLLRTDTIVIVEALR